MLGLSDILANELQAIAYSDARERLTRLGVTDYDIWLIEMAEEIIYPKTSRYRIRDHEYEPRGEVKCMKRLCDLGITKRCSVSHRYWLTRDGESFRANLLIHRPKEKDPEVQDRTNVKLSRDGLALTLGKLWYIWKHRREFQAKRHQAWLEEFSQNQEAIDQAVREILLLNSKVYIAPPPKKVSGWWTEEMQRQQNDLYWMTPGAFWLNPHGALAEPTPAPDWWKAPAYTPKVQIPNLVDDVVENSLKAPLAIETAECEVKKVKHEPEWLCGEANWDKLGGRIWGFDTQEEVNRFIGERKKAGKGWTVSQRGGFTYVEMLPKFFGEWGANIKWEYVTPSKTPITLQSLEGPDDWTDNWTEDGQYDIKTYDESLDTYKPRFSSAKDLIDHRKMTHHATLQMIKNRNDRYKAQYLILKHRQDRSKNR